MTTRSWMTLAAGIAMAIALWRAAPAGRPWHSACALAFSRDGTTLAAGWIGGLSYVEDDHFEIAELRQSVTIFDAASGDPRGGLKPIQFPGASRGVPSTALGSFLDFAPDGGVLAVGSWGGNVILWDVALRRQLAELPTPMRHVSAVRFSDEGHILAAGGRDSLALWETANPGEYRPLGSWTTDARAIAMSPGAKLIAHGGNPNPRGVELQDPRGGGQRKRTIPVAGDGILSLSFGLNGRNLAIGGTETAVLWDLGEDRRRFEVPGPWTVAVALSPDGETLATAGVDGLRFWDIADGEPAGGNPRLRSIRTLLYSPNGRWLAAGDDHGSITVWEMPTGRQLWTASLRPGWDLHPMLVLCLAVGLGLVGLAFGGILWEVLTRVRRSMGAPPPESLPADGCR